MHAEFQMLWQPFVLIFDCAKEGVDVFDSSHSLFASLDLGRRETTDLHKLLVDAIIMNFDDLLEFQSFVFNTLLLQIWRRVASRFAPRLYWICLEILLLWWRIRPARSSQVIFDSIISEKLGNK